MGDFNLIYQTNDKSNNCVNRHLVNSIRATLDALEVKELQLHERWFTWSSGTANPTQSKIDHIFASKDWELANQNCYLQALGSSM
jgi:endonuclease/exonuclease/phosphatase family metal-dependent hydrolase